jgi:hypothetical protein
MLAELHAGRASLVTIEPIPASAGSDWQAVEAEEARKAPERSRGNCVARFGGNSIGISSDEARALIDAGAKDYAYLT